MRTKKTICRTVALLFGLSFGSPPTKAQDTPVSLPPAEQNTCLLDGPQQHGSTESADTGSSDKASKFHTEKQMLLKVVRDQPAIWTSPLHIQTRDLRWLIPFAAGTVALIATDADTSRELSFAKDRLAISRDVSQIGIG